MTTSFKLEEGKCYLIRYNQDPKRKNAKTREIKAQILEIKKPEFNRQLIITNHRPWGEGGSGQMYLDQIIDATEIPRGPVPR